MPSITLSRLQCRELLAHLDNQCDSDVFAEVQRGAELGVVRQPIDAVPQPTNDRREADELDKYGIKVTSITLAKLEDYTKLNQTLIDNGMAERVWTQADVDKVNNERVMAYEAQQKMAGGIPYHALAGRELPAGSQIEKIEIGGKNRFGHTCVNVDAQGFSVFACSEGHGYVDNQPGVRGCPRCYLTGGSDADIATAQQRDRDAIPGEEHF